MSVSSAAKGTMSEISGKEIEGFTSDLQAARSKDDTSNYGKPTSTKVEAQSGHFEGVGQRAIEEDAMKKPWIGYRVEYRNRRTNELLAETIQEKGTKPILNQIDGPIFEVITSYKVATQATDTNTGYAVNSQSLALYFLRINSIAIINAIQSVVQYYPGQDLSGEYLTIQKPYPVLVHHYDELRRFRDDCLSTAKDELCIRQRDVAEHLRVLLDFLDEEVMENVREEQERNRRGYATFEWMWVAYKPGITILKKGEKDLDWMAGVVHSIWGGVLENPPSPWTMESWKLAYDGRLIIREWSTTSRFSKFDGEGPMFHSNQGEKKLIDPTADDTYLKDAVALELLEMGKRFVAMLDSACYQHNGKARVFPHIEIDGLVMVDIDSYLSTFPDERPTWMGLDDLRNWGTECTCDIYTGEKKSGSLKKSSRPLFNQFDLRSKSNKLQDHHLLLLPSTVIAYVTAPDGHQEGY